VEIKISWSKITGIGVLLLLTLVVFGMGGIGPLSVTKYVPPPPPPLTDGVVTSIACDPATGYPVDIWVENEQNDSTEGIGATLYLMDGTIVAATGTANTGASISYKTLNSKDCTVGKVLKAIANPSTTNMGGVKNVKLGNGKITIYAAESAIPTATMYTELKANESVTDDTDGAVTFTAAVAIAQDGTDEGYFKVSMGTSGAQFGGTKARESILVGYHSPDTSKFSKTAFSISRDSGSVNLVSVDCANYPNARDTLSLHACWLVDRAIASQDDTDSNGAGGNQWLYWSIKADKGNPGASDDPTINYIDLHELYDSTAQKVIFDGYDNNLADIGETNLVFTLDYS